MLDASALLGAFRSVMPHASGVVLASSEGAALAWDVDDPAPLAQAAVAARTRGESALVTRDGLQYLVVFMPPGTTLFRPRATAAP